MRKTLLVLLLLSILSFFWSCEPDDDPQDIYNIGPEVITTPKHTLSSDEVMQEAQGFLDDINPILTRSEQKKRVISSTWKKSLKSKNSLYYINFSDSLGFVIISNDPRKEVLGFSLSGNIKQDKIIDNPGLLITLSNLEAFASEPSRVDSIDHYEYGEWTSTYYPPNTGYCQVKWRQGNKYIKDQFNYYCPDSASFHCPAGCVPVATAQLMSMYGYPSSYGSYSFDWTAMKANSAATAPNGEYYVGRLLQQLGLPSNLNVSYHPSGSGASSLNIPQTLQNFGYSQGGSFNWFTNSSIQDLQSGYPIIIRGQISPSGGGHAWLGHGLLKRERQVTAYGYDGEIVESNIEVFYYVLCNFGWGGSGDGYYDTNIYTTTQGPLFPDPTMGYYSTGGYDFYYSIGAITGIRP